jgi:hypothetical protein
MLVDNAQPSDSVHAAKPHQVQRVPHPFRGKARAILPTYQPIELQFGEYPTIWRKAWH